MIRVPFRAAALAALAAVALAPAAYAVGPEMVVNGSFESPAYTEDGVYASAGDGWIKSFMGPVSIIHGQIKDGNNQKYGKTKFGQQYLGIDPRTSNGFYGADSQEISGFVTGHKYHVSLQVADSDGGKAPVLEVIFSDGGSHDYLDYKYDVPVGGPYGGKIAFNHLQAVLTSPVTGTMTLTLRNSGDNFPVSKDSGSISIDAVSIKEVTDDEAAAIVPSAQHVDAAGASSSFQH